MLTYQVRPRVFRISGTRFPTFPLRGEITLHLGPQQPFGVEPGGGRTAVRNTEATGHFNANNGQHSIESKAPLKPLDVTLDAPDQVVRLQGSELTVTQSFGSLEDVAKLIDALYFAIPALLAVEFADPPFVQRVDGTLGGVAFRWELEEWGGQFLTTTQEDQEEAFAKTWDRLSIVLAPQARRVFAAVHYFHTAARLSRVASVAGEFLPEVILNLAKTLEVLFPPGGDGRTRDAVRSRLAALGFTEEEIDRDYLPAMALRNEIDVGHVDMSLFKPEHLKLIHGYTQKAEAAFRLLLSRVLTGIKEGTFTVAAYDPASVSGAALKVIERMRQYADTGPHTKE